MPIRDLLAIVVSTILVPLLIGMITSARKLVRKVDKLIVHVGMIERLMGLPSIDEDEK